MFRECILCFFRLAGKNVKVSLIEQLNFSVYFVSIDKQTSNRNYVYLMDLGSVTFLLQSINSIERCITQISYNYELAAYIKLNIRTGNAFDFKDTNIKEIEIPLNYILIHTSEAFDYIDVLMSGL